MAIKKYSKVKFTLRKELVIILSVILLMVVATILLLQPTKEQKFVAEWSTAGSTIVENTIYEKVDFDDLDEKIAGEEVTFVLFAHSANAEAVKVFDIVLNLASTLDIEKVYLVDSAFAEGDREEDTELDAKLAEIEAKFVGADDSKISLSEIPNLWAFQSGKLVAELDQDLIEAEASDYTAACLKVLSLNK